MSKLSERGVVNLLVPLILVLGIGAGVFLLTSGNPLKLFTKAAHRAIVFKSIDGKVLPKNSAGIPKSVSPTVKIELTSTLGLPPADFTAPVTEEVSGGPVKAKKAAKSVSEPIDPGLPKTTVSYKLAQTPTGLDTAPETAYVTHPTVIDYHFGYTDPAIKCDVYQLEAAMRTGPSDKKFNPDCDLDKSGFIDSTDFGLLKASSCSVDQMKEAFRTKTGEEKFHAGCDLDKSGLIDTSDFGMLKSAISGTKFIWVEFKDATGKTDRKSAQIEIAIADIFSEPVSTAIPLPTIAPVINYNYQKDYSGIQGKNNLYYLTYIKSSKDYSQARFDGKNWTYIRSGLSDKNFLIEKDKISPSYLGNAVIRWKAPKSGKISIAGYFQRCCSEVGDSKKHPLAIYSVRRSGKALWNQSTEGDTKYEYNLSTSVSKGVNIEFWVDANNDSGWDGTYLDFTISYSDEAAFKVPACEIYGDLNLDGKVSSEDKETVLKIVTGGIVLSGDTQYMSGVGDVNGDDSITSADALAIDRFVAGKESSFPACVQAKAPPCEGFGDVSTDGKVTLFDGHEASRITVGLKDSYNKSAYSDDQKKRADVNGDGKVTSSDSLSISRYVKGLDKTFPVCPK